MNAENGENSNETSVNSNENDKKTNKKPYNRYKPKRIKKSMFKITLINSIYTFLELF